MGAGNSRPPHRKVRAWGSLVSAPAPRGTDPRVAAQIASLLERVQKDQLGHDPYHRAAEALLERYVVALADDATVERVARAWAPSDWSPQMMDNPYAEAARGRQLVKARAVLEALAGDPDGE